MKKKVIAALLSTALVMSSLAGCGEAKPAETKAPETKAEENEETKAPAADGDVVKIGVMISYTGSGVQQGEEVKALCSIIEDLVNNKHEDISFPFAAEEGLPGLGGAKIQFVFGDQSTTDVAQAEAERLITQEGVIGICGAFSSATTKTALVAAEKYGVPLLSEGTSPSLQEAGYVYYGRTLPGDDIFIENSFSYLDYLNESTDAGIKNVCLVSEDSEFGTNIAKVEAEVAAAHGFNIIENISYNKDATNVTSEVLRVKAADADVVFMSSYAADALLFMSAYKEQGYMPKMLFGQRGGFMASDFTTNLGSDSDYVLTTARWNYDAANKASQDLVSLFSKASTSNLLGDTLIAGWDATVLLSAANQAGSTDGDAMMEVLRNGVDIDPACDPFALEGYEYQENGQNKYGAAVICQYLGSELATVYPEASASKEVVYPALAWDAR